MTNVETRPALPKPVPQPVVGLALAVTLVLVAAILFLPAGRLDWTLGWIYLGIVGISVTINWVCLLRWNPELIDRRMRHGKGTKTWDKIWAALFAPVMIAIYVVAGLEARDDVSVAFPEGGWLLGLLIFVVGSALLIGSMIVNPFFEKTVRIQTDHGHHVIDTGPYAYVRHPGYVGFVGWVLSSPLLLASVWAFVPALLAVLGIVIRTALEDRTLHAELPGYPEYAARVRYRLIPGLW